MRKGKVYRYDRKDFRGDNCLVDEKTQRKESVRNQNEDDLGDQAKGREDKGERKACKLPRMVVV